MANQTKIHGTALVAGGGSGIGRGCALKLASMGYKVMLLGRTAAKLDATAAEITQAGGQAETFVADVRDWDRLVELGARLEEPGLDVLINSAGGQKPGPAAEFSREDWQKVIDLNLNGSFFLLRHLRKALAKKQGSAVTVVAAMWNRPAPFVAHSGAARAGIVNLTRTLALEWGGDRIRINAVAPGLVNTAALRPQYRAMVDRVPLGRIGEVDEIADAILFMAHNKYITGEVLTIDGGLILNV